MMDEITTAGDDQQTTATPAEAPIAAPSEEPSEETVAPAQEGAESVA